MFARPIKVAAIAMALCALAPGQEKQLHFEVASVRPNKSGGPGARLSRPSPLRWEAENVPLMFSHDSGCVEPAAFSDHGWS
jgi:hypothetical protein